MPNIPLQGLERAKYTADSDATESTVRVNVGNSTDEPVPVISDATQLGIQQTQILCALDDITSELKKINLYFQFITDIDLGDD